MLSNPLSKRINFRETIHRSVLSLLFLLMIESVTEAVDWSANWIWQSADGPANTWVCFRKTFDVSSVPSTVVANIAVDSKYWLWIDGEMVIFEGAIGRGPSKGNTWYDEIDITPYLKTGTNTIAILVWYFGRSVSEHTSSGKGGLVFQADIGGTVLESDNTWKMKVNTAYDPASGGGGDGKVVAYSVKYDGNKDLGDWMSAEYNDDSWSSPTQKGVPPCAPWNKLEKNYVPNLTNHGLQYYTNYPESSFPFTSTGKTYTCHTPFNMQLTPYLEVESTSGKTITMIPVNYGTDARSEKIDGSYTTKSGVQSFESYSWMNSQSVDYKIPEGVVVNALKYRWTSVGDTAGSFECSDDFYQRLWWMARNTLFVCARDHFMDCPCRERTLWVGDVADQVGGLFYSMGYDGRQLLQKDIRITMAFRNGKVFGSGAPGMGGLELPAQSLQFASHGVWQYYYNTGDIETLKYAYPAVHDYLTVYNMQANGLVDYREGRWDWTDWGTGSSNGVVPDKEIVQNCLYYLALKSAKNMAQEVGNTDNIAWYEERISSIKKNFNSAYWNGSYYCTGNNKEDRANGWAIVSGLADSSEYASIVSNVLIPVMRASPHIEWTILEAMCMAGQPDKALERMKSRYGYQVNSTNHTSLNELFGNSGYTGTVNHAWNAPNTVLSRYIAGIAPEAVAWSTYHVLPQLVTLTSLKAVVPTVKGDIHFDIATSSDGFEMNLTSPPATTAILGVPKDIQSVRYITANGKLIWDDQFQDGADGVTWNSEDDMYLKFNVAPGTWKFNGSSILGNLTPGNTMTASMSDVKVFLKGRSLVLVLPFDGEYHLEVYTIAGEQMLTNVTIRGSKGENHCIAFTRVLAAGFYFVSITNKNGTNVCKTINVLN